MDIELESGDGFSFTMKYKEKVPDVITIILTTQKESSRKGYLVGAFRYIDKCFLDEMEEALLSARAKLGQNRKVSMTVTSTGEQLFPLKDIFYIDGVKHKTILTTSKEKYSCQNSLTDIGNKLEGGDFYLVNRSTLINLNNVVKIDSMDVEMRDGIRIPISRRKIKGFRNVYTRWTIENGNG